MVFFKNVYRIFCLWVIFYWKFTSIVTEFCFFKHMLLCNNLCEHIYRAKIPVSWKYILCCLFPKMLIWHIFHQIFGLLHNWKLFFFFFFPVHMTVLNLIKWVLHCGHIQISLHMTGAYYCIILLIFYTVMKKLRANCTQGILATTWSKGFLSCQILCKKYNIKILQTIILPVDIWMGKLVSHFKGRK